MGGAALLGRVSLRVFASAAAIAGLGWLGGCGDSQQPTAIAAVKKCLRDEGFGVRAARAGRDDEDAPDRGELITAGALLGFYSSAERAEELAAEVRRDAGQARGDVVRYGEVTVVYLPDAKRDTIEDCVETDG
jgi:hypothetical protein